MYIFQIIRSTIRPISRNFCTKTNSIPLGNGISFQLTEELQEIRDLAKKFTRDEIIPVAAHHDKTGEFPMDIVRKAHKLGLMNTHIPAEYGGLGLGVMAESLLGEEFGYGCTGIKTPLIANNLGVRLKNIKLKKYIF